MRVRVFSFILTAAFLFGASFAVAAAGATGEDSAVPSASGSTAATGGAVSVTVVNLINMPRRASHASPHGLAKPPKAAAAPPATLAPPVVADPPPAPVRPPVPPKPVMPPPEPSWSFPLHIDAWKIALVLAAIFGIVAAFVLGRMSAGDSEDTRGKAGEWLDMGVAGSPTVEIEARVRGEGGTWRWQRISRQKLIDHLNTVPKIRETLLDTAPAQPAPSHGSQISTVVNQSAH